MEEADSPPRGYENTTEVPAATWEKDGDCSVPYTLVYLLICLWAQVIYLKVPGACPWGSCSNKVSLKSLKSL